MNKLASIKKQKNIDHHDEHESQEKYAKTKVVKNKNDEDSHRQFKKLYEHKDWSELNTQDSVAPSDYTVTHINQTHDFLVRIYLK
jgi:hypothetical protein